MAGMLPGVEAARRRRIHGSSGSSNTCSSSTSPSSSSSRRLSFSLFSTNNPNINTSASTFLGYTTRARSRTSYEDHVVDEEEDTKLGALAREAKFRLDAKLRSPSLPLISTTITRNYNRDERISSKKKKKKNGKVKKLNWSWKTAGSGDRNHNLNLKECAVCLDDMKEGDDIIDLECHHTFHSSCLTPWLHTNPHCPCCRLRIINS